jgi:transketolase
MLNLNSEEVEIVAKRVRRRIIEMSFNSGKSAHIGGALSLVEILSVLYGAIMNVSSKNPTLVNRDRLILSKGHGVLALFAVLAEFKFISESIASTYMSNESELIAHPIKNLQFGIESSNGSLGQGLSYGSGLALGAKLNNLSHKIYVLLGDGECNEGLVWESAAFASQSKLDNVIAVVDCNGFQNDGNTESIIENSLLADKWRSFGWNVIELDGHNVKDLAYCFQNNLDSTKPNVIIAKTVKGKGVSFMESNNTWHHNRITESSYRSALEELN